ncbi:hypothetical protein BY458DRAFT_272441 [Sporodiniella umbellata]|nr:hypothetical protein BY458DRAFT_272441 [Sporodiniella umbellata]
MPRLSKKEKATNSNTDDVKDTLSDKAGSSLMKTNSADDWVDEDALDKPTKKAKAKEPKITKEKASSKPRSRSSAKAKEKPSGDIESLPLHDQKEKPPKKTKTELSTENQDSTVKEKPIKKKRESSNGTTKAKTNKAKGISNNTEHDDTKEANNKTESEPSKGTKGKPLKKINQKALEKEEASNKPRNESQEKVYQSPINSRNVEPTFSAFKSRMLKGAKGELVEEGYGAFVDETFEDMMGKKSKKSSNQEFEKYKALLINDSRDQLLKENEHKKTDVTKKGSFALMIKNINAEVLKTAEKENAKKLEEGSDKKKSKRGRKPNAFKTPENKTIDEKRRKAKESEMQLYASQSSTVEGFKKALVDEEVDRVDTDEQEKSEATDYKPSDTEDVFMEVNDNPTLAKADTDLWVTIKGKEAGSGDSDSEDSADERLRKEARAKLSTKSKKKGMERAHR